jgi:DNA-binding GntR family transcriptional regulator
MLESAWNVTEPFQPMSLISTEQRRCLHADHGDMLRSFLTRDAEALLLVAARHLDHLDSSIAGLPVDTGLFTDDIPSVSTPGRGAG